MSDSKNLEQQSHENVDQDVEVIPTFMGIGDCAPIYQSPPCKMFSGLLSMKSDNPSDGSFETPDEDENQVRFDIDNDVLILPPFGVTGD